MLKVYTTRNSFGLAVSSLGLRSRFNMFRSTVAPKLSIFEMKQYSLPYRLVNIHEQISNSTAYILNYLFYKLIQETRIVKWLVEITVSRRVPCFQVSISVTIPSNRHERLLVDSRKATLIESVNLDLFFQVKL